MAEMHPPLRAEDHEAQVDAEGRGPDHPDRRAAGDERQRGELGAAGVDGEASSAATGRRRGRSASSPRRSPGPRRPGRGRRRACRAHRGEMQRRGRGAQSGHRRDSAVGRPSPALPTTDLSSCDHGSGQRATRSCCSSTADSRPTASSVSDHARGDRPRPTSRTWSASTATTRSRRSSRRSTRNSKIPAILDPNGPGGRPLALFESGAILLYLADKTGQLDARRRGGALRDDPVADVPDGRHRADVRPGRLLPQVRRQGLRGQAAARPLRRRSQAPARRCSNGRLASAHWLMGDDYTIADIAIFPWVRNLVGFYGAGRAGRDRFLRRGVQAGARRLSRARRCKRGLADPRRRHVASLGTGGRVTRGSRDRLRQWRGLPRRARAARLNSHASTRFRFSADRQRAECAARPGEERLRHRGPACASRAFARLQASVSALETDPQRRRLGPRSSSPRRSPTCCARTRPRARQRPRRRSISNNSRRQPRRSAVARRRDDGDRRDAGGAGRRSAKHSSPASATANIGIADLSKVIKL